jgi:hypothetical protein
LYYYELTQRTSRHSYLRVARRLESIYALQGKTRQHGIHMIKRNPTIEPPS